MATIASMDPVAYGKYAPLADARSGEHVLDTARVSVHVDSKQFFTVPR
jgi:hypothetical protein